LNISLLLAVAEEEAGMAVLVVAAVAEEDFAPA
jgi:hypothetical protein